MPEKNIYIEYDGEQHFKPWRMKDSKKAGTRLKDCQFRDSLKTKYCAENTIILVRIRYDEDILEKLKEAKVIV